MSTGENIRLCYPLPIAKLYEAVQLESEPRQRVRKLIDLYERTSQYLVLVGLASYAHYEVSDPKVEALRPGLERPSLGHWSELLKALSRALRPHDPAFLTAEPRHVYKEDAISAAAQAVARIANVRLPKRIMMHHFLDAMVEFRNKKIGHGVLSSFEARQVGTALEKGLTQWLGGLSTLHERQLLHVARVEWQAGRFVCTGTDLNAGTSLAPARLERDEPVDPDRVYLHFSASDDLILLYPFFTFNSDTHLLYVYSELSAQGKPVLRCPYEAPGAETMHTLDVDRSVILGSEGTIGEAVSGPGVAKTYDKRKEPRMPPTRARRREYTAMKNWFDIIQPHEDIRKGDFDEAVFAADLGDVVDGSAPPDYSDPYLFFCKTYLTDGLRHLLARVYSKLTAGKGQSVIEIQTPFGGGKTHSLVTIYHYLQNGAKVRTLLPDGLELISPQMSVIVGMHHNPVEGRSSDGLTRRTFWGEIGYQLAGREGYQFLAENDQRRVSPGKTKLKEFLSAQQPFILLFDEILEYINRAAGVAYEDTTLASQTFAFFQELTETVAALPQGMMVVTLPSSYLEDYGERKEESLARLSKIFGRLESIETPVKGEEVYAIVRRRLFENEVDEAARQAAVHDYFKLYQGYRDDLPPKARDLDFKRKMELAYPFHPDVIDILYEKWSTFSSFQRTRGVLRLLANVVEDLYQREVNINLILPGDLNLARPAIRQEFLKHIGMEYEGVIGSDVAGHEAKAQALDDANRPWKHLAERIATAVFFHSFSAGDSEKGIGLPYIKLATLRSDTMPAMVTEVLQRLSNALWYLNSRADVYYFSRIPNLNRMILDKKELFNEAYEDRLREIVRGEIGTKFTSYLWPEGGDGIPDNRSLKLVILHPQDSGAEIPAWIERRGETFRVYKNTLFFALPDTAAFVKLKEDVKTYMALEEIKGEIESGENPALAVKRDEIQRRMHNIARDFSFNVRRMYHTLQVGDRQIDLGQPVAGSETLSHWYWRELEEKEEITTQLHYRMLVNKFMAGKKTVATQAVLDQFYKDPGLPAPASTDIVARAIQLGIQEEAFGFAPVEAGEIDPEALRFETELTLGAISFDEGFVLVEQGYTKDLLATLEAQEEITPEDTGLDTTTVTDTEVGDETGAGEEGTTPTPHYRSVRLVIADIPAGRIADVNRGILIPISRAVGDFTFTLEIDVSSTEGISQATLENKIKETIRQIGANLRDETLE